MLLLFRAPGGGVAVSEEVFEVALLPAKALERESRHVSEEYMEAHEEMRAAVALAIAGQWTGSVFERPAVSVFINIGSGRGDGRYRPRSPYSAWPTLDPIYRALIDAGILTSTPQMAYTAVGIVSGCAQEGLRIVVRELTDVPGVREESE